MPFSRTSLLPVLCFLAACRPEPPPEAPPPSGCGPGMGEVALRSGASLCVDLSPVPLASYEECVGRALCSVRPAGNGCLRDDLVTQQKPVNCVDAAQADAFCKAHKKRLLTREELAAVPFSNLDGVRWSIDAEWTSTAATAEQTIALHFEPKIRTFFDQLLLPANTQQATVGFRCGR